MALLSRRRVLVAGAATVAVGVGAIGAYVVATRPAEGALTMTPAEAHEAAAAGRILLVDIRRPDEWARTGVPEHALRLDMRREDFLARLTLSRGSTETPVAVICARGVRSARLTHLLHEAGVAPIIDVPEGMLGAPAGPGWLKRGLPVTPYTPS